jgi:hypothetical protein
VWKLWKRYRETGTVTRRAGTIRKRKTTVGDDDERFLRLQALRNRKHTARDLQEDLVSLLFLLEQELATKPSAIG